mgnify:FL=1
MKGLLLKDGYQTVSQMKTMYLTVVVVLVVWMFSTSDSYAFPISYAAIFLGVLPVNLLGYDQNSGWVEYSLTLPVSKKVLVAEKYLVGLLCAAASVVISGLFAVILSLRKGAALDGTALFFVGDGVNIILLMNSISLPLMYRFGAEKARMIYILTFAGFGALIAGGGVLAEEFQTNGRFQASIGLGAALFVVVLVLYVLSWRLSVAWYGKYKR